MLFSKSLLNLILYFQLMIQRKQSIFLLVVAVLMSWALIRPYAQLVLEDGTSLTFYGLGIEKQATDIQPEYIKYTVSLFLLILLTGSVNLINIFLFNRRIVQIRLCIVSAVLLILITLTMLFHYTMAKYSYDYTRNAYRLAAIFPIIGIIMNFLAFRGIHQDEALVKSYDRIR
jgi:hypothetical protein